MRTLRLRYMLFVVSSILFISLFTPGVHAAGADAELHNVEVSLSPSSQGLGGLIIVDAAAFFYGGCCYHLFANEVTANLTVPEGIEILEGPSPEIYAEVDAQPGGTATVVHFKWTVKGISTGDFNITANVMTKNCGSEKNTALAEIVQGCSISSPVMYPKQPSVNKKNIFQITASIALEGRDVKEVSLFYLMDEKLGEGEAQNDTLVWEGSEKKGVQVALSQDPMDDRLWTCKLDLKSEGTLLFWFVAQDNMGENTTSSVFVEDVVDPERDNFVSGMVFWSAIIIAIIGILLIFLFQHMFIKRREARKGIIKHLQRGEERLKGELAKRFALYALLFLSLIVIIFAFLYGVFTDIIELAMG